MGDSKCEAGCGDSRVEVTLVWRLSCGGNSGVDDSECAARCGNTRLLEVTLGCEDLRCAALVERTRYAS